MTHTNFEIQEIEDAFERIRTHKLFKRSTLHIGILRYLIDQAIAKKEVKEQTIGSEVLKENYANDQNSSKVRVYVYNLRKKLSEYYKEAGINKTIIFQIEKGQYNLTFKQNSKNNKIDQKKKYLNLRLPIKPVIISSGIALVLLLFLLTNSKETYIWNVFLANKSKTLCVIADHYMLSDKPSVGFFTRHDIRNNDDLVDFSKNNPDRTIKTGRFTMTTKMASFGVHILDQWFHKFGSNFRLQLESDTQYSDYNENNIIYIGQYSTMVTSNAIFLKNSNVFKTSDLGFVIKGKNGIKKYDSKIYKINSKEYTMVSFQKLENGNHTLFFVSNHDIGVIATLKMFTSEEKLKDFIKKLPSPDKEFNALFEVNGFQRNDMNCELIELEIIE